MRKCKITKGLHAGHFVRLHFHRAKPVSEMKRSGIERALRRVGKRIPGITKGLRAGHFVRLHFHRAKPVSEMKRSGIERALRRVGKRIPGNV